ncbi:hypothetical protein DES53_101852 [Roseimicrobium gellanilyticum]|uniref:Uncharacterized protein n=2 Tax=Roseimicrobium gellanilyticum TaxID=748857 RepID=A0A366HUV2_9BACT|nr:hypothetical protein DES53_101852 [Roseimicrobium gellanilyticum]
MIVGGGAYTAWELTEKRKAAARAEKNSAKEVRAKMGKDMEKLMTERLDADGRPRRTDFRLETGKSATTHAERAREFLNGYANDVVAVQNEYLASVEKAGLDNVFDLNRMAADPTFQETDRILEESRAATVTCLRKLLALADNLPKRLDEHGFDEAIKRDILQGYNEGKESPNSMLTETWNLELSLLDEMKKLCDHLHATRSVWTLEDGQFVFQTEEARKKYIEIQERIDAIDAQKSQIQQEAQNKAMKRFKAMQQ